ncbi:MAG: hypothetical protein C0483_23025 [Pirellula sp.]|nr:hypothetical protein [Pirellula sp.]
MSEKFNPLKTWLGVTAGKPSYYQLLGLENFESEPPVIAEAADRAIRKVQKHLQGEHRETAEKLARDLATVKSVLTSSEKRQAYDAQLRGKLGVSSSPRLAPAPAAAVVLPQAIEAADSPTMMLPPGALSAALGLPSAALPPSTLPPQAHGPGGAYGAPPNPYGAPNPTGYGDPGAFGLPQPQAGSNPFAPQGAYPQPYGQENQTPGYSAPYGGEQVGQFNFGPPGAAPLASPTPMAANPMMPQAAGPSAGAGVPFAPKTAGVRTRVAGRKQQQSNFTVALAVLGVAAVVLVIVIVVVSQQKADHDAEQAKLTPPVAPHPQPVVAPLPSQNIPLPPVIPSSGNSAMTPTVFEPPMESESERERRMAAEKAAMAESPKPAMTTEPAPKEAVPVGMRGVEVTPVVMEASLPEDAVRAKSVPTMLSAARTAIRTRDYFKAEDVILQAQITADSPALVQSTLDHARALDLVRSFWEGVREGIKGLKAGDELTFNAKTAVVVRHDEVNLVVKQDNKEIPLVIDKLIPGLAAQLAERGLAKDAASTKLVVGMFLALDQSGDHAAGRTLFDEAAAGGLDVGTLRPIIEAK